MWVIDVIIGVFNHLRKLPVFFFPPFRNFPLTLQDLETFSRSCPSDNVDFSAVEWKAQWMDEPVVVRQSLQLILEKSTSVDWILRMRWLCHLAKNLPSHMGKSVVTFCVCLS